MPVLFLDAPAKNSSVCPQAQEQILDMSPSSKVWRRNNSRRVENVFIYPLPRLIANVLGHVGMLLPPACFCWESFGGLIGNEDHHQSMRTQHDYATHMTLSSFLRHSITMEQRKAL